MLFNPFLIPIVGIAAYFFYCVIDSIGRHMAAASRHRADVELKMTLAQQGMSAEEILRVVSGTSAAGGSQAELVQWEHEPAPGRGNPVAPHKRPTASRSNF